MSQMQFQHARKYGSQPYRAHTAAPHCGSIDAGSRSAHCVDTTRAGGYGEGIFRDAQENIPTPTPTPTPTPAPRQVLAERRAAAPRGGPRTAPKKNPATFRRHQRQENIHIVVDELDAEYERELLAARSRKAARIPTTRTPTTTRIPTTTTTTTTTHTPRIPTEQSAVLRPPATATATATTQPAAAAATSPYGIRERPITPFGLRFRYRQWCRDMGTRWVECRGEIKGKITLIIKGPVPVDNVQEDYDVSDRKSGRNARKSPAAARR